MAFTNCPSFCFWKYPAVVNHRRQLVRAVSSFTQRPEAGGCVWGQYQTTYITEVALFSTALGLNYIISPSQEKSLTLWAFVQQYFIFFFIK